MFSKHILDFPENLYDVLSRVTVLEDIIDGRQGGNIADIEIINDAMVRVPVVRTTTPYINPTQNFRPVHFDIIEKIKRCDKKYNTISFNNAMVEKYDSRYRKMKFHSDQSLDLDESEDSYICIFSCYSDPETRNLRKLVVVEKNKEKAVKETEFILEHNSIVIFPVSINQKYLHKIVLSGSSIETTEDKWLGITFRKSKTFIEFRDRKPYFLKKAEEIKEKEEKEFRLASSREEVREFMKCKGIENEKTEYEYPDFDYTISLGDIAYPII